MDRLAHLYHEGGQSPWLDNLKRSYVTSGRLAAVRDSGIRGLTSNPTIFQKAIQGSPEYDDQFRSLVLGHTSTIDSYWQLVLADIRGALDVFAPLHQSSDGLDGYLAKRFGWTSGLGKVLDPVADKLLLVSVFITASWLSASPVAPCCGLALRARIRPLRRKPS